MTGRQNNYNDLASTPRRRAIVNLIARRDGTIRYIPGEKVVRDFNSGTVITENVRLMLGADWLRPIPPTQLNAAERKNPGTYYDVTAIGERAAQHGRARRVVPAPAAPATTSAPRFPLTDDGLWAALVALGATEAEVAATIRAGRYLGTVLVAADSPVAHYAMAVTGAAEAESDELRVRAWRVDIVCGLPTPKRAEARTPVPVALFETHFDLGMYPDLIRREAA